MATATVDGPFMQRVAQIKTEPVPVKMDTDSTIPKKDTGSTIPQSWAPSVPNPNQCEDLTRVHSPNGDVSYTTPYCIFMHNTEVDSVLRRINVNRCTPSQIGATALPGLCYADSQIITGLQLCDVPFSKNYTNIGCAGVPPSGTVARFAVGNTLEGAGANDITKRTVLVPNPGLGTLPVLFSKPLQGASPHLAALWNNLRVLLENVLSQDPCSEVTMRMSSNTTTQTSLIVYATELVAYLYAFNGLSVTDAISALVPNDKTLYSSIIIPTVRALYNRFLAINRFSIVPDYFKEEVLEDTSGTAIVTLAPNINDVGMFLKPVATNEIIILEGKTINTANIFQSGNKLINMKVGGDSCPLPKSIFNIKVEGRRAI